MSMPNVPDIKPEIELDFDETINLLLTSIALEELSIAHIMNAEAEKIQEVIKYKCNDLEDLLEINKSVEKMVKTLIYKEILLENKFENVLTLINSRKYCSCKHLYKSDEK